MLCSTVNTSVPCTPNIKHIVKAYCKRRNASDL